MPLFKFNDDSSSPEKMKKKVFNKERDLKDMVESNMDTFFQIKFVDDEVSTGPKHGGRIDSLGIDRNGSPVIIEYKKDKARDIINQGLFYLDWLVDHRGDFQVLVNENLDNPPDIEWERPRVILIANNFTKYDRHAVQRIGENIELKEYTLFEDVLIEFEDVYVPDSLEKPKEKSSETEEYDLDDHFSDKPEPIQELFYEIRDQILEQSEVTEVPVKHYIAYKANTNFCTIVPQKSKLRIFLHLDPGTVDDPMDITRDMSEKGHWGTGNLMVTITPDDPLEPLIQLIETSHRENT